MTVPSRSYLVCATPRSGSSFLCGLLKSTGIAGRAEEYFWRNDEPVWAGRWRTSDFASYLAAALSEGSTPNGVFAAKVMWGYFHDLLGKLAALSDSSGLSDAELLDAAFPRLKYIVIVRRDTVAQAVSFARAIQTNQWSAAHRSDRQPAYDFQQIHDLVREIEEHNRAWQQWYAVHDISPRVVFYEDLLADVEGTTHRILDYLKLDRSRSATITQHTVRQTDALNTEWITRYHEDLATTR